MVRVGDRVGGRYQVLEQLAAGGMGSLWRAHHIELEVDVALKVVLSSRGDPLSLERFSREAKAAARLRSPNIVHVLDYGVFEGAPFLVMELLRGEDLASCIAREGKLAPARCVRIVEGLAKAMQFAHDEGVIHRDLKPANIFLERVGGDEVVKILDFGVAKDLKTSAPGLTTSTGSFVGSPAYMSPEQVWSERIGYPSDIWAMGVVAFEMLTGDNPFDDETLAKVFERIVREPLPSACALHPALPPQIDGFFAQAFARTVTDRVPSAREFASRFAAALSTPPAAAENETHARPSTAPATAPAALPIGSSDPAPGDASSAAGRRWVALTIGVCVLIAAIGAFMLRPATGTRVGVEPTHEANPPSSPRPASVAPSALPAPIAAPAVPVAPAPAPFTSSPANAAAPARPAVRQRLAKAPTPARPPSQQPTAVKATDPRFGIPVDP
jgi:serine/threonine-protein kinase